MYIVNNFLQTSAAMEAARASHYMNTNTDDVTTDTSSSREQVDDADDEGFADPTDDEQKLVESNNAKLESEDVAENSIREGNNESSHAK